jgi:Cys-tRNA(Pro)/Cys-tRNA(Cys) deacylase
VNDLAAVHPRVAAALAGVPHTVHRHADQATPIRSPADFAAALGYPLARIAKTLLVQAGQGERYALVVAPVTVRLDLRRAAAVLDAPRLRLAPADAPVRLLGYPPTGVSPLGAPGYPVLVAAALLDHPTILVGAGVAGVEIEMSPTDLLAVTGGRRLTEGI